VLHDRVLFPVSTRLQEPLHRIHEVVAVELGVKPDDARAEHPFEQLVSPGADSEPLRVGPGDVPEGDDGGPRQPFADETGCEREVVVLDEHDRVLGVHLLAKGFRELLVDRLVVIPVLAAEDRTGVRDVTQRPEALVRKAVVVTLLLLR
jgi:hypothetical protein